MQEWFTLVFAFGSHIESSRIRYSHVLKFVSIHYGDAASGSGPNASLLYQFAPERILMRKKQRRTWLAAVRQLRSATVGRYHYPSRSTLALLFVQNGGYISMESETDYLIVGCGAAAMAFADVILDETDATITIVDRRDAPGGHWNDAYPFVKLHQPSAYYGVASRAAPDYEHFTILGPGKTAIDAVVWLLTHGAPPEHISWVLPRDP